jgi:hypothetical protein
MPLNGVPIRAIYSFFQSARFYTPDNPSREGYCCVRFPGTDSIEMRSQYTFPAFLAFFPPVYPGIRALPVVMFYNQHTLETIDKKLLIK